MAQSIRPKPLIRIDVRESVDVYAVQRGARAHALAMGFSLREAGELVLVASELATNILKYGKRGWIALCTERGARGVSFVVEARDFGPPFHDFDTALKDRHDDRGPINPDTRKISQGLGVGLGTVVRLTDRVEHVPLADGKIVRAVRAVPRATAR